MSSRSAFPKKLLEVGWAGEVSDEEAEYIATTLTKNDRLRKLWQRGKRRKHRKVSAEMVKTMVEEDRNGRHRKTNRSA